MPVIVKVWFSLVMFTGLAWLLIPPNPENRTADKICDAIRYGSLLFTGGWTIFLFYYIVWFVL